MARRLRLFFFVYLTVCAIPVAAAAQVDYIDPAGGFTQVVTTTHGGVKTVFVSGQVGRGDTFREHVESAFAGVVRRLGQAGATPADVVKIRIFVKDFEPAQYGVISEVRLATFPAAGHWPASTMIGVRALAAEDLRVEIEAIAVVAEPGAALEIERFAPANGFSGAVAVTAHGVRTVYVAGQVGTGDTLAAQATTVWESVGARLAEAGASLADLVKATTYIVDFNPETDLAGYRAGREQALSLADMPASTLLGVPALAAPQFRIEIDGIAVVGTDGREVERAFIDPATGFTQAVSARGTGPKVVQVSGQVGVPGDPLESQADQVYANLRRRLAAAGAAPEDLLKVVIYMPEYRRGDFAVVDAARKAHGFPDETVPAATLLGIQSLFADGALVEIEGIAVVGSGGVPDDVHPVSRSRLPPIDREELDPARRAAYDAHVERTGRAPGGAAALRLHGSGTNLRFDAPMGRQLTELTILTTAREYDQPYEWALHELEAIAVGLDDGIIDVVRHRKPLTALSDREAIIVEVGRELFGTRRLGADTYARALALLGKTNLVDVIDVMGRYASTAATLTGFNQRMPVGWRQSLPLPFTHPDDIHPDSRSRLPLRSPESHASVSVLYGRMLSPSGIGPNVIRSYGDGPATLEARVGRRLMQLAVLVTAWAHDSQYDWTVNEPRARAAGLEAGLIDIVRRNRPLDGVAEKDAALIAFGRELFGDHNVSAETYARAERAFGVRDLVDLVGLMGAHAADAAVLAAFDQQLPAGVAPLLPVP